MPPKSAQRGPAANPETPKSKAKKRKAETPEDTLTPTPKKKAVKKDPPVFKTLESDDGAPVQIEVRFEGDSTQAKLQKNGKYLINLKLEATNQFSLVKTLTFTTGHLTDTQAIIIQPAKAFPILRLPDDIRRRVYKFYLAPNGVTNNPIVLESRRSNKDVWAKSYSEGHKHRVGLLTANKQIHDEATPLLYEHGLRLENTGALVDFLICGADSMKSRLTNLEIKTWVKNQSRHALNAAASCTNLTRLHIDSGLFSEGDPEKAAKAFWAEGQKFLEAMSAKRGVKGAGVEVLSLGRQALTAKEGGKGEVKPWGKEMREEFLEALRGRMM